jgi:hypothetical protein
MTSEPPCCVRLRDIQEAASHIAGPRTTICYDWCRQSLDRHAAFVAGAAAHQ